LISMGRITTFRIVMAGLVPALDEECTVLTSSRSPGRARR
jgi:hypothetical protein